MYMRNSKSEKRERVLNFRFSMEEDIRLTQYMHRFGYTSISQMLRDAAIKKRFTQYISPPAPEIYNLILLFDALEAMRMKVKTVAVNTVQILRRFEYFHFLSRMFNGLFQFNCEGNTYNQLIILNDFYHVMVEMSEIIENCKPIFFDEKIMANTSSRTILKIDPIALRREYNRPETEPWRKLEIIRTLYMNGLTSYIPEEDKVLYRQLVDARERHDKLKRLYEERKLR